MKKHFLNTFVLVFCFLVLSCSQAIITRDVSSLKIQLATIEEDQEFVKITNELNAEYYLYRMEPLWQYSSLDLVIGNTIYSGIPYKPGTNELFSEEYDGYQIVKADSDRIGVFTQGDWRLTLYILDKDFNSILKEPIRKNISMFSSSTSVRIDLIEESFSSEKKCSLAIRNLSLEIFGEKEMYGKEEDGGYKLSVSLFKDNGEGEPTLVARKDIDKSQINFSKEETTNDGNIVSFALSDLIVAEDFAEDSYLVSIDYWEHDGDSFSWDDFIYFPFTSRSGFYSYIEGNGMPIVFGSISTPTPVEFELVEASIRISFGRSLSTSNDVLDLEYKYSMEPMFTLVDGEIQGATNGEEALPDDGNIGLVTCGLWKIKVNAYRKGTDIVAFMGESQIYLNKTNTSTTIYLSPTHSGPCTIIFDFSIEDLGTYGVDYYIDYSLSEDGNPVSGHQNVKIEESEVTTENVEGSSKKVNKISKKITLEDYSSIYVTCTLRLFSMKDNVNSNIGGISKTFILSENSTVTISGEITTSDFSNNSFPLLSVKGDIELVKNFITISPDKKSAVINLTLTDNTDVMDINTHVAAKMFSRSYSWFLNGDLISEDTGKDVEINTPFIKEISVTQNCCLTISCISTWSTTISGKEYKYTMTVNNYVTVTGIE